MLRLIEIRISPQRGRLVSPRKLGPWKAKRRYLIKRARPRIFHTISPLRSLFWVKKTSGSQSLLRFRFADIDISVYLYGRKLKLRVPRTFEIVLPAPVPELKQVMAWCDLIFDNIWPSAPIQSRDTCNDLLLAI